MCRMKKKIIGLADQLGIDDVGIASIENYNSPNSMDVFKLFPNVKNIVVLAFQQVDNCESENVQFGSVGIKLLSDFSQSTTYKVASYIKRKFKTHVMIVPQRDQSILIKKHTYLQDMFP